MIFFDSIWLIVRRTVKPTHQCIIYQIYRHMGQMDLASHVLEVEVEGKMDTGSDGVQR